MLKQRDLRQHTIGSAESGFTLIELLVVIFIVAILMAIAAPGWLALANRQRVNTAREDLLQVLRNTQTNARTLRSDQTITFGMQDGVPSYSFDEGATWQSVGDGNLKPGIVELSVSSASGGTEDTLTFEYNGALSDASLVEGDGYKVILEAPSTGSKSCLVIRSILGATTQESDDACS